MDVIAESQKVQILRKSSPPHMLKAESAKADCSGLCPVAFQISTKMETPQLLWATCSGI